MNAAAGHHPDWGALYSRHKDQMWRAANAILSGDRGGLGAEDAVMDAMRGLMASPPSDVRSWEALMVTTAKRRALDLIKSGHVKHSAGRSDEEAPQRSLTAPEVDVAEGVDRAREASLVREALLELPPRHQQVLRMRFLEGLPVKDVADTLGVSGPRVSQLTTEGLKMFRKEWDERGGRP